jgi:hypothetical protein
MCGPLVGDGLPSASVSFVKILTVHLFRHSVKGCGYIVIYLLAVLLPTEGVA